MRVKIELSEEEMALFIAIEKYCLAEDALGYRYFIAVRGLFENLSLRNAQSVISMLIEEMAAKEGVTFREYAEELIRASNEVLNDMGEYIPLDLKVRTIDDSRAEETD